MENTKLLIILSGVIVVLLLAGLYGIFNLRARVASLESLLETEPQAEDLGQAKPTERISISVDDDPSIGPENAAVTIVEFSDFQCSFCAAVQPTIKQILDTYGDKVRLVFRDFPVLGPRSQKAAEAAECADEQGKFWEYHDKLFQNQQALAVNNLKQYAADLGLNTSEFNNCLDSGKMASEIQKDFRDGQGYGVDGTPIFFINGILVSGARPYEVFELIIEHELSQ